MTILIIWHVDAHIITAWHIVPYANSHNKMFWRRQDVLPFLPNFWTWSIMRCRQHIEENRSNLSCQSCFTDLIKGSLWPGNYSNSLDNIPDRIKNFECCLWTMTIGKITPIILWMVLHRSLRNENHIWQCVRDLWARRWDCPGTPFQISLKTKRIFAKVRSKCLCDWSFSSDFVNCW